MPYEITFRTHFSRQAEKYLKIRLPNNTNFNTASDFAASTLSMNTDLLSVIHSIRVVPTLPLNLVDLNTKYGYAAQAMARRYPNNKIEAIKSFREEAKVWLPAIDAVPADEEPNTQNMYNRGKWQYPGLRESKELIEYYLELNA